MALLITIRCQQCGEEKEILEGSDEIRTICHDCEDARQEEKERKHLNFLKTTYARGRRWERLQARMRKAGWKLYSYLSRTQDGDPSQTSEKENSLENWEVRLFRIERCLEPLFDLSYESQQEGPFPDFGKNPEKSLSWLERALKLYQAETIRF